MNWDIFKQLTLGSAQESASLLMIACERRGHRMEVSHLGSERPPYKQRHCLSVDMALTPSRRATLSAPSAAITSSCRGLLLGLCIVASCLVTATNAFYLPGSAPRSFAPGDPVPLLVNALSPQISSKKRLGSLLPYDYYKPEFHFCRPGDGKREPKKVSESLGSVLFGDRLYESPFEVRTWTSFVFTP